MNSVVLVTVDSLRADRCGYLAGGNLTPALDGLAEEGIAFENAVAPGPSTYESLPATFTGRLQCAYPVEGDAFHRRPRLIALNTRRQTIPEWFAERDYATGAFTANPFTAAHTNFARGFDHYQDLLGDEDGPLTRLVGRVPLASELLNALKVLGGERAARPWRSYYEDLVGWTATASEPYFLWVFLLEPHTPYLPPQDHRPFGRPRTYYHNGRLWAAKKWGLDRDPDPEALQALYDGAVRSADEFIATLRSDLPGDPVLAVHADHGEAFGEHGSFGHGPQLYEENVHVPLAIAGGGLPDRVVTAPTSLASLPSLLRGAARGEVPAPENGYALCRTLGPGQLGIRGDDWKYIATVEPGQDAIGTVGTEVLYDLGADPGERVDRSAERAGLTAACRNLVERRLSHEREVRGVYDAAAGLATDQ